VTDPTPSADPSLADEQAAVDEGAIHAPAGSAWPMGEGPWRWADRLNEKLPRAIRWAWATRQGRYTLAGGWNTLVGSLIFWALYWALGHKTSYMLVGLMSHFVAVAHAYAVQRSVVFRLKIKPTWAEYWRFNVGYLGTLGLSLGLLWIFVGQFKLSPYFAQAGIAIFGAVAGYFFHSRVSFAEKKGAENAPEAGRR
jgi:putative flippase GtrA